jgi:hypothetical protein
VSRIRSLFRNLLQRESVERELDDDLRVYQQMLIEEKRASGLSEEDAVRETCLEIGPLQAVKTTVGRQGWVGRSKRQAAMYGTRCVR